MYKKWCGLVNPPHFFLPASFWFLYQSGCSEIITVITFKVKLILFILGKAHVLKTFSII